MIDRRKLVRWYDFQAPLYRLWRNRYGSPLVLHVAARIARGAPSVARVLDAGCGTGLFSIACARTLPAGSVVGVDLSSGMLAVAAAEARRRDAANAVFVRADAGVLPFRDGGFDAVVAAGLLPNLDARPPVLRELGRVLAGRGRLHVVEFDRKSMTRGVHAFFVVMILGYRFVSWFFRGFRFAERWDVRASTVEPAAVAAWAREAGLVLVASELRESHRIYELAKGADA